MEFCKIKDVEVDDIDSLINLCVPPERRNDKFFIEGIKAKKAWAIESLEKFGSIAKNRIFGLKASRLNPVSA